MVLDRKLHSLLLGFYNLFDLSHSYHKSEDISESRDSVRSSCACCGPLHATRTCHTHKFFIILNLRQKDSNLLLPAYRGDHGRPNRRSQEGLRRVRLSNTEPSRLKLILISDSVPPKNCPTADCSVARTISTCTKSSSLASLTTSRLLSREVLSRYVSDAPSDELKSDRKEAC